MHYLFTCHLFVLMTNGEQCYWFLLFVKFLLLARYVPNVAKEENMRSV